MRKLGRILFAEQRPQPVLSPEQRIPVVINRGVLAQDGMETWTINGKAYDGTRERLHAGVRYRLIFANKSDEGHPLHLHRHLFELTRVCGRAVAGVWKDV